MIKNKIYNYLILICSSDVLSVEFLHKLLIKLQNVKLKELHDSM